MPRSFEEQTELHKLLLRLVPKERRDKPRVMFEIADMLGCTRATVYNWIKDDKLPAHRAKQIVDLSDGTITIAKLHKFVYAA